MNTTAEFGFIQNIIFGGSAAAYLPHYADVTVNQEVQRQAIEYLRVSNPNVGLYFALG